MSEIMTPGAPTNVPAGFATQSLTGGFPSIQLSDNVAGADIIELTGVVTVQSITVIVPQPLFPTQVQGSVSFSGPTAPGWSKIFKNSTPAGAFQVIVQALGGPNSVVIPAGETFWVYSPDGFSVFAGSGPAGSASPLAVFFAAAFGVNSTLAPLPGTPIAGALVGPVLFQGTRIMVQANFEGAATAGAVSALQIELFEDGLAVPKVASLTPPALATNVNGSMSWIVANVPGTSHTFQLNLASSAGGTVTIDATNNLEFANLIVSDLP